MNIAEFLTFSLGTIFLFVALVFAMYTIKNARHVRYPIASKFMASGAFCFLASVIIGAVNIFLVPFISGLTYFTAISWGAGVFFVLVGQVLRINVFKKVHGSLRGVLKLPSSKWLLVGTATLIFGVPVYLTAFDQSLMQGLSWYSAGSVAIWTFAFACLTIAERKSYLAASTSSLKTLKEIQVVHDDKQTLVAYSNLTNRLLAHIVPAIGAKGIEDALAQCAEDHPILLENKFVEDGMLNVDLLIKNINRIHETEKTKELFSAFSDLNTKIIDLYAALTSATQAINMVATEAEIYRGDATLWKAGVPLGKYSEAVYEREILVGLPDGVADDDKVKTFAYILFKRYLERLLSNCKRSKTNLKKELGELAKKNPAIERVRFTEDGKLDISKLYEHLSGMKIEEGMREVVRVFSILMDACYSVAKKDLGTKQASEIASEIFCDLLRRHGGFLQHYNILEAIPEGVQIPGTYRPLVAGKSYLIEGRTTRRALRMFSDMVRYGNPGLLITTSHPAHVRKEHNIPERITVLWLSKIEVEFAISPSNLGILRDRISAFVSKNENAVVMLEGLEYLITTNGFDLTLKLLHDIRETAVINRARLIVPVAPGALETRQLEMLRRYMEVIKVEEEEER